MGGLHPLRRPVPERRAARARADRPHQAHHRAVQERACLRNIARQSVISVPLRPGGKPPRFGRRPPHRIESVAAAHVLRPRCTLPHTHTHLQHTL
ncbi:hypothetical protein HAZT_HAZT008108, partial [Hyalella azteca]